jgi:hypothetical protein
MIKGTPSICDRCGRVIAATVADPTCHTSAGTHHFKCMVADAHERRLADEQRRVATRAKRAENARRTFGYRERT